MGTTVYPATPYNRLKREQLIQLAYALEEQRDRALAKIRDAEIEAFGVGQLDEFLRWLVDWNDERDVPIDIRVLKIAEENGEAVDAYLGMRGANPRKGVTNGVDKVRDELADTALAALVALQSLGGDAEYELHNRARFVVRRLLGHQS